MIDIAVKVNFGRKAVKIKVKEEKALNEFELIKKM